MGNIDTMCNGKRWYMGNIDTVCNGRRRYMGNIDTEFNGRQWYMGNIDTVCNGRRWYVGHTIHRYYIDTLNHSVQLDQWPIVSQSRITSIFLELVSILRSLHTDTGSSLSKYTAGSLISSTYRDGSRTDRDESP